MLHLFIADDLWDAMQGEADSGNMKVTRRDVWAFCPACQTTYDFPLVKRKFVISSSSELVKQGLSKAKDSQVEQEDHKDKE